MFKKDMQIAGFDDELWQAIQAEEKRQEEHIELIASENYTSPRVMQAQGSVLTNKYAEGYPAKRYYGGCEYVDVAEQLAIDRAKRLFNCNFANAPRRNSKSPYLENNPRHNVAESSTLGRCRIPGPQNSRLLLLYLRGRGIALTSPPSPPFQISKKVRSG